jgi:hypothetical protein
MAQWIIEDYPAIVGKPIYDVQCVIKNTVALVAVLGGMSVIDIRTGEPAFESQRQPCQCTVAM